MNSNALDLLNSLQFNNSSNNSYKANSNKSFNKSFQDVLSNKQPPQDRLNIDNHQKRKDFRRETINNTSKDREYEAKLYNKSNDSNSQDSIEKISSTESYKLDNQDKQEEIDTKVVEDTGNIIEDVEINIDEIEKTIESILSLIGQLDDWESISSKDIELLAAKLEELVPQLEAIKVISLGQELPTKLQEMSPELQNMSTELLNGLEKLIESKELVGLDVKQIFDVKDILVKLKLNNTDPNNSEININSNKDDSKDILMSPKENSDSNTNDENSKSSDKNENSLSGTNSNSGNNVSVASNNQDKAIFNQTMINGQIQKETFESQNQIKGDTAKLFDIDKNNVIKQIVDKVKVDVRGESTQIKIKLKPDFLGEMSLKLSMEKGVISAKAMVQDYQVKQLIEANLSQLRDNLEEQGISIEGFEVFVGDDSSFERQSMNWSRQNNRRFNNIKIDENEDKYENYLDGALNNNSDLELDELLGRRSSINLMA